MSVIPHFTQYIDALTLTQAKNWKRFLVFVCIFAEATA